MKTKAPLLIVAAVLFASSISVAAAQTAESAPAAARYYPLIGSWKGHGELSQPGQAPAKLVLDLACSEASSGFAVRCDMTAENESMTITESDLMGVDPVTGEGHWYAVTNQGEVHDHVTEWIDAKTMKANYAWQQDGKKMQENVTFKLLSDKTLEFTSVVTADGEQVGMFSGLVEQ